MHLDDPLSDKEFDELDQFLMSNRCPDETMTMDALHGFFSALAIGPETIMPSEWLPHVWGGEESPTFKNEKEATRIIYLVTRFMNEIITTLEVAPKDYEPLFCEVKDGNKTWIDGEAWAWGFWSGIELRPDAWQELDDSEQSDLLRPFYLLGAEEIEEEELALVETPQQRHQLAIEMEANFPLIMRFWLPRRKAAVQTIVRESPKQGRNDPCACGSGKKFKQCCGKNTAPA